MKGKIGIGRPDERMRDGRGKCQQNHSLAHITVDKKQSTRLVVVWVFSFDPDKNCSKTICIVIDKSGDTLFILAHTYTRMWTDRRGLLRMLWADFRWSFLFSFASWCERLCSVLLEIVMLAFILIHFSTHTHARVWHTRNGLMKFWCMNSERKWFLFHELAKHIVAVVCQLTDGGVAWSVFIFLWSNMCRECALSVPSEFKSMESNRVSALAAQMHRGIQWPVKHKWKLAKYQKWPVIATVHLSYWFYFIFHSQGEQWIYYGSLD